MGIEVLPPDVNRSGVDFTPLPHEKKRAILFGLSAVRNVGLGAIEAIIKARQDFMKDASIDNTGSALTLGTPEEKKGKESQSASLKKEKKSKL